jgi:DNA mismatch repair protein MutS2
MDAHTLDLLEFPLVLADLCQGCLSEGGRRALETQGVSTDPAEVGNRLDLAVAFRRHLESTASFPALSFPDLRTVLDQPHRPGSVFEPEELAALGTYILSATKLRRYLARAGDLLAARAEEIPDLTSLSASIFRCVDPEGAIKERSIPELAAIRARIRSMRQEVDGLVARLMAAPDTREYWQSDRPTIRNSRTVLPLKSAHRGRVRGIVHEVSGSGATIFIEPEGVVERNNDIVHQEAEYQRVLLRILRDLAARVTERAAEVLIMAERVSHLDTYYARARYAERQGCARAEVQEGVVDLREARHPLIGPPVVPTTLSLGGDGRVVIVTGPNTGGKTVVLKTLGLMVLMNQFGMEIPAAAGSRLGIVDGVWADIGDEQSLEQSLSTFSGHIVNLARIARGATPRSLVLLDELGAGTDPEEGVAIAMALLDHFIETGCPTCVTTHHGILKNYGYSREGVRNACMEFDDTVLRPTYRLIMGLPGRSYAIEIARRNGLSEDLVERSRAYLSRERTDAGQLIQSLSSKQEELYRREREQQESERRLAELRRESDLRELRVRQRERELRAQGLRQMETFLAESRSELERVIREMREGEGRGVDARLARELIHGVEERLEAENAAQAREVELQPVPRAPIASGMDVIVGGTGTRGTVLREARKGVWLVATETLRAEVPEHRLSPAPAAKGPHGLSVDVARSPAPPPVYQLDVRGQTYQEAISTLDRQMERAILAGLAEFSVIHGKGEGVLQRGIHEHLRADPNVEDYFFASPVDGGFGKTIVRLVRSG